MTSWNFNGTNRTKHNKYREFPSRRKQLLRQAIQEVGLKVIGYEYEIQDPALPYWIWYDVACEIKGRLVFLFVFDEHVQQAKSYIHKPLNVRARQRKIDYAKYKSIPFIEVRALSQDRMQAQIEFALMFLDRKPYNEAPFRLPPGWRAEDYRQPIRGKRFKE